MVDHCQWQQEVGKDGIQVDRMTGPSKQRRCDRSERDRG